MLLSPLIQNHQEILTKRLPENKLPLHSMISILYPEGDYTAADIAIKLQALAQGQANQIFIVPKHFGRSDENVYMNLKKSKTAILLIHDKSSLDAITKQELSYLRKNKSKVYCIAPNQAKRSINLFPGLLPHYYDKNKPGDFLNSVQGIVKDLQRQTQAVNDDFGVLLVVMALIILIVGAFGNGKK